MQSVTSKLDFIEKIFGKGKLESNGKNFSVRCPICAPSDLNKKKLAIRVSDDAHHCWTCGWSAYSLAPLIKKFGTTSQLVQYKNEFAKNINKNEVLLETSKITPLPSDFRLLMNISPSEPDYKAAWNYLISRNIEAKDAWYFKLGLSQEPRWKRRIIMPSFDEEGNLNFFIARNIDKFDKRTKYDNPDDDKYQIVFNEMNINWTKKLVICEGPFDLMKCGENATALLGSDLSPKSRLFSQILLHSTPVVLALDGDMWHTKTPKFVKLLQSYDIEVSILDTRTHGDPGSMTKTQFKNALDNISLPTWESMFFTKLEKISNNSLALK